MPPTAGPQVTESWYNAKSDIWSAGCVMYELAALQVPFQAASHFALAQCIQAGHVRRESAESR